MIKLTIGQTATRAMKITDDMVRRYADLTGDVNPLHFDDEFVRRTRFGERITHGGLTIGLISAIVGTELPGPGSAFVSQNFRFANPVYIGDTITAKVEVIAVKPDKPMAQLSVNVTRQDGAPVLQGEVWVYLTPQETTL